MDSNSFWFGYRMDNFLFCDFDIESVLGFIAICITTAIMVIVFEFLKTTRVIKKLKFYSFDRRSLFRLAFYSATENSTLLERPENVKEIWKVSDIVYHFFELMFGYLLMMIVMTFNAYIMISVCIGAGIAYLILGTALMNVTAQVIAQRMCAGCHSKDGECTPASDFSRDGPSTSCTVQNETHLTEGSTTVQVHF